jgi:hypothetical protein
MMELSRRRLLAAAFIVLGCAAFLLSSSVTPAAMMTQQHQLRRRRLGNCKWVAWKKKMVCEEPAENVLPSATPPPKAAIVPVKETDDGPAPAHGTKTLSVTGDNEEPSVATQAAAEVPADSEKLTADPRSWSAAERLASGPRGTGLLAALVQALK